MSLAGLKKQINKANQYVSERVGAAEPTKLDEEYTEMERKVDLTVELVEDLLVKTREYLQPNPATRAKMSTMATLSKFRGTSKNMPYPQPEGTLGESMLKYGRLLSSDSGFGQALVNCGEAYREMADIKYALEDNVRQNFLDPLTLLENKDLKDVLHHRKKLQGRRLDYDCKKRQNLRPEELVEAEKKLEESKQLAETAMFNVLENDVEQVSQLCALVSAQLEFHRQTTAVLENLEETLKNTLVVGYEHREHKEHIPKPVLPPGSSRSSSPVPSSGFGDSLGAPSRTGAGSSATSPAATPTHSQQPGDLWAAASAPDPWSAAAQQTNHTAVNGPSAAGRQPQGKALYDFDALNEGELALKEGQIVHLVSQIDENWYEGQVPGGPAGYFPINYIEVTVPLP